MFTIDQNCHPLWDALPKLQALAAKGHRVTHFVEDVDVAFTALGSTIDDEVLHLARERFHRSGGQDWGAALFYSEFLGRLPVEIRDWEPFTGLKTKTLARQLGRSVDDLYDEFSPGDTWQLIGSSYVGDRLHHRVIGDLSVAETRCFLYELFRRARENTLHTFPQAAAQERTREWFRAEQERIEGLMEQCADARLVDLYRLWLQDYLPADAVRVDLTSSLFARAADPARTALLEIFLADYPRASTLYNEALEETNSPLRPLKRSEGELPFYAILQYQGHLARAATFLRDGELLLGHQSFPLADPGRLPLDALAEAGVQVLCGKALLLIIQARIGSAGRPLVLPHRGSAYMPAVNRLVERLAEQGLMPAELHPIIRVRFHLLDRMASLDAIIRLPGHLVPYFGRAEVTAKELAAEHEAIAKAAAQRLEAFQDEKARQAWQRENLPELTQALAANEERRRQLAFADTTPEQMSGIWTETKALQLELLDQTLRQIARDHQARDLGYWDSRGALLPWCIALGGKGFYDHLIANAKLYEEPVPESCRPKPA